MSNELVRPWFGTWPPTLKGEEYCSMKTQNKRYNISLIMALVLAAGIIVVFLSYVFQQRISGLLESILANVGIAMIVAGILGLTIDKLFRQQLAEDAFKASVGYILPEELK